MKHLYFMRHGLSEMNKLGLFSGRLDTPLTKEGIKQCEAAGHKLKDTKIDLIVSSPMKRAFDSAKIVADIIGYPNDKIAISDLFMERDLGPFEGDTYIKGLKLNDYKGVEHSLDLVERAKSGIAYLNSLNSDSILVVSHSAMGRALKDVTDPDAEFDYVGGFKNAEIVKLI